MIDFKNIVFDLGNVLVRLDEARFFNAMASLGLAEYLDERLHPESRQLMHKLGLGLVSTGDFCNEVRRLSGMDIADRQIVDATNTMLVEIPEVKKEALLKLKAQGKRLFLLSNTLDIHWDYCVERLFPYKGYRVEDYFESVFLSQRMHMEKPDPKIFKEVVRQTGIGPDDTLFIDDLEANCIAARQSVGWHVYQNKNFDDWMQMMV